jgi:hypothetical protein
MSTWRRKAIALFPDLATALHPGSADDSRHEFFSLLASRAADAHRSQDQPALRKIHGFLEWSLHQSDELWQNAAVGFYEDLFAEVPWEQIVPWLSPFVIAQVKRTWALGVGRERAAELDDLVRNRREAAYRTHVFATGEIDSL